MEDKNHKAIRVFLNCIGIGFLISSIRVILTGLTPMQIVQNIFISFWYNLIVGIGTGIAAMFTAFLYEFLKKRIGEHLKLTLCFL